MDLAEVTSKMQSALASGGFDKIIKFDFGSIGKILLDGPAGKVSNDDGNADATVNIDFENFLKMAQGQLDPMQAFMSGKLKVAGDMSAALKLQSILGKMR
jgi:putative sterol carrier protein